jgi:hypothetical protein
MWRLAGIRSGHFKRFSIKESKTPAYVMVTREKTGDAAEIEQYKQFALRRVRD